MCSKIGNFQNNFRRNKFATRTQKVFDKFTKKK